MSRKSINFDDRKINKSNFYKNKKLFQIDEIDFDKKLVSKKESYGRKSHLNTSLSFLIKLHVKDFDSNKTMSFKANDNGQISKPKYGKELPI